MSLSLMETPRRRSTPGRLRIKIQRKPPSSTDQSGHAESEFSAPRQLSGMALSGIKAMTRQFSGGTSERFAKVVQTSVEVDGASYSIRGEGPDGAVKNYQCNQLVLVIKDEGAHSIRYAKQQETTH